MQRFITFAKGLWKDESGVVTSSEMILIITILGIGMITGLSSLRLHVNQQFGDFALALEKLDQSYNVTMGTQVSTYNDTPLGPDDVAGAPPGTITVLPGTPPGEDP